LTQLNICDRDDNSFKSIGLDKIVDLPKERDGTTVFPFGRFVDGTLPTIGKISIMYDRVGKEYFTFQYRLITEESEDYYSNGELIAEGQIYEDRGRVRCKCDKVQQ